MEIRTVREGNVLVALTENRVDGADTREFQDALEAVIDDGDRAVVLDMARLTYISSAGLRVILLIAQALQRRSANFALCSLSGTVGEVFEISGFDRFIRVHDTQADAIAALLIERCDIGLSRQGV